MLFQGNGKQASFRLFEFCSQFCKMKDLLQTKCSHCNLHSDTWPYGNSKSSKIWKLKYKIENYLHDDKAHCFGVLIFPWQCLISNPSSNSDLFLVQNLWRVLCNKNFTGKPETKGLGIVACELSWMKQQGAILNSIFWEN